MRIFLSQQQLKFLVFTTFTLLGILIIFTGISITTKNSSHSNTLTAQIAQNPQFQTIYEDNGSQVQPVVDTSDNNPQVLGANDNCGERRTPTPKGADPSRGLHPDCALTGANLPYKAPISGGNGGGLGYSGGEITVVYDVCLRDLCVPEETLSSTFNCANESCPFYTDSSGGVYLKKPDAGRTFDQYEAQTMAPLPDKYAYLDSAIQRNDNRTTTYDKTVSQGTAIQESDTIESTYDPAEFNFLGLAQAINQGFSGDTGVKLSTASTNDLAQDLADGVSAPGLWNDGRLYDHQDQCTQYNPGNNTILDTTKKTDKCYLTHIKYAHCETRSVTVNLGEISTCVNKAIQGYQQQLDKYNSTDHTDDGKNPPTPPSSADCTKGVDLQVRTTGLYGNSFDTSGSSGGRSQVAIDTFRSMYVTPGQVSGMLDSTVNPDSINQPLDNPLASTMWLTNATVDVHVKSPIDLWIYRIKTTALWPDPTFDWHYESQEVTSIPNSKDIVDRKCYNDALQKFYSDRNYGACSI